MSNIISSEKLNETIGPFGDSDGSRVEIKEAIRGFIDFSEFNGFSGLTLTESDINKRVIVGRKGAGKTLYLRRLQDFCNKINGDNGGSFKTNKFQSFSDSVYVTDIDFDPPSTRHIIKITSWYPKSRSSEIWTDIWKIAILRSVYTHIFFSKALKNKTSREKVRFERKYKLILPKDQTAVSVYSQLKNIIVESDTKEQLEKNIDSYLWDGFEVDLGNLVTRIPPLYFFIDAVDEDFAHAPMYWLRCQKGLFYAIFRGIRNQVYGGRLHVIISIREAVFSQILQSEHSTRYIYESKIKNLSWTKESILFFLRKKIEILDNKFFVRKDKKNKQLSDLLNLDEITLTSRDNFKEGVEEYLLRHTRLLPRDIVNIGNCICEHIEQANHVTNFNLTERDSIEILKKSVHICAKLMAHEQIAQCANQITSNWMYNGAVDNDDEDLYTGDQEMKKGVENYICDLINSIKKERFHFNNISDCKVEDFGFRKEDDPFSTLWQFGLLGYVDKSGPNSNKEIFFSSSNSNDFILPANRDEYVFHSILIDYLNIKPSNIPVYVYN